MKMMISRGSAVSLLVLNSEEDTTTVSQSLEQTIVDVWIMIQDVEVVERQQSWWPADDHHIVVSE